MPAEHDPPPGARRGRGFGRAGAARQPASRPVRFDGRRCGWAAGRSGRTSPSTCAPGEFVAVLGPNGVGKSTLIKAALGLVPLVAGSATVLGRPPGQRGTRDRLPAAAAQLRRRAARARHRRRAPRRRRRPLGRPAARREPACSARAAQPASASQEVIELVGADRLTRDRPIGQVSGGEQQRLLIAQALVRRPAAAAPRRAARQPRPAQPGAVAALIAGSAASRASPCCSSPTTSTRSCPTSTGSSTWPTAARCPAPRRAVITSRDAHAPSTARRSRCCAPSDGRLVVVGQPEAARPSHRPARRPTSAAMVTAAWRPVAGRPRWRWNLGDGLRQLFALHFMVNAFRAGTIVAVAGRGDRLVHGAAPPDLRRPHPGRGRRSRAPPAAILLGVSATARLLRLLHRRRAGHRRWSRAPPAGRGYSEESAVIGTVQAFALACGFLFVSLYGGFLNGLTGLLFGTFLGISDGQVVDLARRGRGRAGRAGRRSAGRCSSPRSIPTWPRRPGRAGPAARRRSSCVLLGCAAAEVSQITGALLVFALLVMPAATAQRLTARPGARASCSPSRSAWPSRGSGSPSPTSRPIPSASGSPRFGFAAYVAAASVARPPPAGWRREPRAVARRDPA